ncbi:hypothetical protein MBANPS3_011080 [Mucor bainieri]
MDDTLYKVENEDRLRGRCNACEKKVNQKTMKPWESLIAVGELACVIPRTLKSLMSMFPDPTNLDNFESLTGRNQERVKEAWKSGTVSNRRLDDVAVLKEEKRHEDQLRNVAKCVEDMMNFDIFQQLDELL